MSSSAASRLLWGFGSGDDSTGPGCVLPKGHDGPCRTSQFPRPEMQEIGKPPADRTAARRHG